MKYLKLFEEIKLTPEEIEDYIRFRSHMVNFIETILQLKLRVSIDNWNHAHYYLPLEGGTTFQKIRGSYIFDIQPLYHDIHISFRIKKEDEDHIIETPQQTEEITNIIKFICNFSKAKAVRQNFSNILYRCDVDVSDVDEYIKYITPANYKVFNTTSKFDL